MKNQVFKLNMQARGILKKAIISLKNMNKLNDVELWMNL